MKANTFKPELVWMLVHGAPRLELRGSRFVRREDVPTLVAALLLAARTGPKGDLEDAVKRWQRVWRDKREALDVDVLAALLVQPSSAREIAKRLHRRVWRVRQACARLIRSGAVVRAGNRLEVVTCPGATA